MDSVADTKIRDPQTSSGPKPRASTDATTTTKYKTNGTSGSSTSAGPSLYEFHDFKDPQVLREGQPTYTAGTREHSMRSTASSDNDNISRYLSGSFNLDSKTSGVLQKTTTTLGKLGSGAKDSIISGLNFLKHFITGGSKFLLENSGTKSLVVGGGILASGGLALKNLFNSFKYFSKRYNDDTIPAIALLAQGGLWAALCACLSSKISSAIPDPFSQAKGGRLVTEDKLIVGGIVAPLLFGASMKLAKGQFPLLSKIPFFGPLSQDVFGSVFKGVKSLGDGNTATAGPAPMPFPGLGGGGAMPMAA